MKLDITINREMVINTGNYSTIRPGITLSVKDVPQDDYRATYETLSNLADACFGLEVLKLAEEMQTIKSKGLPEYIDILQRSRSMIEGQLECFCKTGRIE